MWLSFCIVVLVVVMVCWYLICDVLFMFYSWVLLGFGVLEVLDVCDLFFCLG